LDVTGNEGGSIAIGEGSWAGTVVVVVEALELGYTELPAKK
jgi:hypothetical protein